ncbi:N-acetyltransferase family protein [Undibacterium cyanobacteriorum]|uniref:N-acetyltransferase family protein n=1 Tax=Undibacterium cyanobacteriorum TaxID=3073561 RepID=A0ABY9RL97_9BURK|nr:arsinothricin resistance N-acetyltransferase ArsN1 family B [Undibacterium sp. 20NA77.5]WMW80801.1 N-acetyltransferase family protein [Undibacterium sp. 20NA77.5]
MTYAIRPVAPADASAICRIYNHYVENTTITFEEVAVTIEAMEMRLSEHAQQAVNLPWLVLCEGDQLLGYAYATPWRARSAYRFSVETTVYVDQHHAGKGIGRALYDALLSRLRQQQLHCAIAGIALPNFASVALHECFGFEKVAEFQEVGMKLQNWVNVGYWQLML